MISTGMNSTDYLVDRYMTISPIQVVVVFLLYVLIPLFIPLPLDAQSIKYRWDTKLLIDTSGQRVFNMRSKTSSVKKLATPTLTIRPSPLEMQHGKRAFAEKHKVTIPAILIEYGKEPDGDYHLVLKNPFGNETIIAEIPDPADPKLRGFPALRTNYDACRQFIDTELGVPATQVNPLTSPLSISITGIVFFDKSGHGGGHAENGVELHPVLKITKRN